MNVIAVDRRPITSTQRTKEIGIGGRDGEWEIRWVTFVWKNYCTLRAIMQQAEIFDLFISLGPVLRIYCKESLQIRRGNNAVNTQWINIVNILMKFKICKVFRQIDGLSNISDIF